MVEGLDKLVKVLHAIREKYDRGVEHSVNVGFKAAYAMPVHENVEMKWRGLPRDSSLTKSGSGFRKKSSGRFAKAGKKGVYWGPHGQAKFLEQPARENQAKYAHIVSSVIEETGNVQDGLVAAGLALQADAQELVPILTGNLKASAFTELGTK